MPATHTPTLDAIAEHGNKAPFRPYATYPERVRPNWIECWDGFRLSVIAGPGTYCSPRPDWPFERGAPADYQGPYTAVEVGMPTVRPEPWHPVDGDECWSKYAEDGDNPTDTVYAYVPVPLVRLLIESHGGERAYLLPHRSPGDASAWEPAGRAAVIDG